MSQENSPIETLFQLQRDTIEQSQDILEQTLAVPREMSDTLYGSVDAQREIQAQALDVSRKSVHTSLDAAESVVGGSSALDDLRDSVDETFDTLAEQQDEAFDTVDEEYDELGDDYEEFSENALENLGDQVAFLVDLNEDVEGQLVEAVEEFTEQFEELQDEFDEQADRFSDLEARIEDVGLGSER